jgi:hypothetical protein
MMKTKKPCGNGEHEHDDFDIFSHPTGDGEFSVCTKCGFGVAYYWNTSFVGERVTDPNDRDLVIEDRL